MIGAFDHPWLKGLLGDPELATLINADAQLKHMLRFEAAYARALAAAGVVDATLAERTALAILGVYIKPQDMAERSARDGVIVPALLEHIRGHLPVDLHTALHQGLTSQDVIDSALMLCLRDVMDLFKTRLNSVISALSEFEIDHGATPLMGYTRMQPALPITLADRVQIWRLPIETHLTRTPDQLLNLQYGGPVGLRDEHSDAITASLSDQLSLPCPPKAWHAMRQDIAEFAAWLARLSGSLGKVGQDICLMAQMGDITLSGAGQSSAMAHKQNPVLAETLVTLARFNATQIGGIHQAIVHEQERSGAAWTLEWMILPQMIMATGRGLNICQQIIPKLELPKSSR